MELLPDSNVSYSTKDYWDQRYTQESADSTYDWFKSYTDVKQVFDALVSPTKSKASFKVLMLGCGNSRLSEEMYLDGFTDIDNIDFSEIVIARMREKYSDPNKWSSMRWIVGDIRNLPSEQATYDLVIDKGTMDALLCYKGDVWNPPEDVVNNVEQEMAEVRRVLKPNGVFLYMLVSPYLAEKNKSSPLNKQNGKMNLTITSIGEAFHYYIYTLRYAS